MLSKATAAPRGPRGPPAPAPQARRPAAARCSALPDPLSWARLVVLPGGATWLKAPPTFAEEEDPVYGDSFVMKHPHGAAAAAAAPARQRQRRHGVGLVPLRRRPTGVALRAPAPRRDIVPLGAEDVEVSIVVLPVEEPPSGIVPFRRLLAEGAGGDQQQQQQQGGGAQQGQDGSGCLAIVPRDAGLLGVVVGSATRRRGDDVPLPLDDDSVYETFNTKHKRRTMKIKFTCQRCGATTIKPVNPHAWTSGSVFARCGRCQVTHKLVDNLKLFHELAGPVFNQPPPVGGGEGGGADAGEGGLPLLPPRLRLRLDDAARGGGSSSAPPPQQQQLGGWRLPPEGLFPEDPSSLN